MLVGVHDLLVVLVVDELVDELVGAESGGLVDQKRNHVLSDLLDLALDQVGVESHLSLDSLRNDLHEDSQLVSVLALDVGEDVHEGLSLSEVLLDLVSGQLELVEGGGDSVSLDLFDGDLDFLGDVLDVELVLLDVRKADLDDSSLQEVLDLLGSRGLLDWGPSDLLDASDGLGAHDLEPLLLHERVFVQVLLLVVLLEDLLVLSFGHCIVYKNPKPVLGFINL